MAWVGLARIVYTYTVSDRVFSDYPAKNTVYTPYVYGSGQPYAYLTIHCLRGPWPALLENTPQGPAFVGCAGYNGGCPLPPCLADQLPDHDVLHCESLGGTVFLLQEAIDPIVKEPTSSTSQAGRSASSFFANVSTEDSSKSTSSSAKGQQSGKMAGRVDPRRASSFLFSVWTTFLELCGYVGTFSKHGFRIVASFS